ncbi:MAG TPA: BTAD domain-containing putative transcriptional regulator, partial [Ktedonobacteraceae bacterium]|nr:BTAD domain-containing putative transcriptional regulator [Ktedonobacteraceae bacterium]
QTALLHSLLAGAYDMIGNYALSEHHRTRAMRCWIDLNDEQGKILNQIGLGVTLQRQGLFSEAETVLTQAFTTAHNTLHFLQGEAYALVSLGDIYQDQGKYDQALNVTEDGLELARQLGDQYLINYTTCSLALTYLLLGDSQTALLLVSAKNAEEEQAETMGYDDAVRKLALGTVLLYQQRYGEAQLCLTRVEASLNASGLKREQLQANIRLAACHLEQSNRTAATCHLEQAKTLAARHNYEHLVQIELQRLPKLGEMPLATPEPVAVGPSLPQAAEAQEVEATPQPALVPVPSVTVSQQSRITIQALGEPVVSLDGISISHWRMARAMELFFFLLDNGRPVHKEQIITALWSELNDQVNQTLRSMIYYLRKILGDSCIVYHAGTYALNLVSLYGESVWYDVAEFRRCNAEAKKALADQNDITANAAFQKMVELYRGDYIQSFYSDWCTFRRDELSRSYVNARHQLALISWRREQFDESIMHWQHILAVDSCLEEAHYGLMRSYLRQGKRGLALRQYQRCIDTLRDELSIEPGPTIQKLYQRLVSNSQAS